MVKVLVMTSEERVRKFYDLGTLPQDFELDFIGAFANEADVIEHGRDAQFIVADAVATVSRDMIEAMPQLKLIHSEGVGYGLIDLAAANEHGVCVCNCAGVNASAVAENAIMLMLATTRRLLEGDAAVREGHQIDAKEQFILDGIPELGSMKVGLIGLGAIGRATALLLHAFGSDVYYTGRSRKPEQTEQLYNVRYLPQDELLATCDIVSLHIASNAETYHYMDADKFAKMKHGAVLINTARGELVDQDALIVAIESGKVAAAGLDTLEPEPATLDNPLLNLPHELQRKVVFTPHVAGTTLQTFYRGHKMIWDDILACYHDDTPQRVVNGC